LKSNSEKIFHYLKKIPVAHFNKLYEKNGVSADMFLKFITSFLEVGLKDSPQVCLDYIKGFPKTYRFDLCIKQTIKSEKRDIKKLLDSLASTFENEKDELEAL